MKILFLKRSKFSLILVFFLFIYCKGQKAVNDGYGDYVLVPAGSFEMGDSFNEGRSDERPVHVVHLDAYYIGKYEIINGEYKKFIGDGGYTNSSYWTAGGFGNYGRQSYYWNNPEFRGGGIPGNENFPVVGINWHEACAYCGWLSAKTGKTYRLPTEAEWEKAACGTDRRRYPWGDDLDESCANYWYSGDPYDNGLTPVGYYNGTLQNEFMTRNNASPYGAYDMAGNVWEFCSDWKDWDYYSSSPANNPKGPSKGTHHVVRGGSWIDSAKYLRCANRFLHYLPSGKDNFKEATFLVGFIGFRCVREK